MYEWLCFHVAKNAKRLRKNTSLKHNIFTYIKTCIYVFSYPVALHRNKWAGNNTLKQNKIITNIIPDNL